MLYLYMGLLEAVALILFIVWFAGLIFHIAGGLIHILLVLAVVIFLVRLIRRTAI